MARIAILGAGGHGRDIGDILDSLSLPYEFFDDARDGYRGCDKAHGPFVVGVNDPRIKRVLAENHQKGTPTSAVHHTVDTSCWWPGGVVIGAGTAVGPNVELGRHVHIGAGGTITRTQVGDYTTIGPGCHIAGDVTIGSEVLIGVGAVVSNLITIGDGAVVGAGAVVVRDVAAGETVVTRALTATSDEWAEKAERFAYGLRPPAK
jgi:acetyltransferase-like isoleucine patch superfamily enzyme